MSYKVAVKVQGEPNLAYNAQRFATREEAEQVGSDIMGRWMAVERYEIQESPDQANYRFENGQSQLLNPEPQEAPAAPALPIEPPVDVEPAITESPVAEELPITEDILKPESSVPMVEETAEPILEEKSKRRRKSATKKHKKKTFGDGSSAEGIQPTYKELREIVLGKEKIY